MELNPSHYSQTALLREISSSLGACLLTHVKREPIDLELARQQHAAYAASLKASGCQVKILAEEPDMPDAVFIEDTAIVLADIAVISRPGTVERRREIESVRVSLQSYRRLESIYSPGTLEGGDVLCLGQDLYVGLSERTNQPGIQQFSDLTAPYGYRVHSLQLDGCLHLKSAVTQIGPDTLLMNPLWVGEDNFPGWQKIMVDPDEPFAANALRIGDRLIYPAAFPRTAERLAAKDLDLILVDVSELQKAEGAVTCCSLIFLNIPT